MSIVNSGIFAIMPVDINQDGIYELQCEQNVSFISYIGIAKVILKYDLSAEAFIVMQSEFIPQK